MVFKSAKGQQSLFDTDIHYTPASQSSKYQTEFGDLWTIGQHKLLCGDVGQINNLERLLDGKRADLIHTDPPYNVNVKSRSKRKGVARVRSIISDNLSKEDFVKRLYSWFYNMSIVLSPGRSFYIWGGYSHCSLFPNILQTAGLHFSQAIVWIKNTSIPNRRDFMAQYEMCFYGWKQVKGYPHFFTFIPGISDVWNFSTVHHKISSHLTEKPVELCMCAIRHSSQEGEIVLDPFAGSGSTLVAAEKTKRVCYLMEIDPWYCSLILDRCNRMGLDIRKEK